VTGSAARKILDRSASAVPSAETWFHYGIGTDVLKSPVHVGEVTRRDREMTCPAVDLGLDFQKGMALYAIVFYALASYPCAEIG
jgi:hypothetical protein